MGLNFQNKPSGQDGVNLEERDYATKTEMEKFSETSEFFRNEELTEGKAEGIAYTDIGNRNRYSEMFEDSGIWYTGSTSLPDHTKTKTIDGIRLSNVVTTSFSYLMRANAAGGLDIDTSKSYRISFFVQTDGIPFFMFRSSSTTGQHESFYVDSKMRRHSYVISGRDYAVFFLKGQTDFKGNSGTGYEVDFYVGGLQVDEVTDNRDGFVVTGDSTVAGGAGDDLMNNVEWPKLTGAVQSCRFYNRGIGGDGTQDIIDRWVSTITPQVAFVNTLINVAGINDLALQTAETIITNRQTMHDLAIADGFTRVIETTITPCNKTGEDETKRQTVNAWIRSTFSEEDILDLDVLLRDPDDNSVLDSRWIGDGIHFGLPGKIVIANYIHKNRNNYFSHFTPWLHYIKVDD